jgi:uncharacterized protein YbgA (DUF1722 family)/uncharacterized protein YbbK (DUF523 family)
MSRWPSKDEVRIGVSACLLGHEVRYDGGHKRDLFVTGPLAAFMTFVPVCPEVEVGLPVPRPAIRLLRRGDEVRLVEPENRVDHTESMRRFSGRRVRELEALDLSGYILKKDSPSCGMERVKVYPERGPAVRDGVGLFAEALMERMALLPVEEEGRLNDPALRENFIERVFAYRRLRALIQSAFTIGDLVRFHTGEKYFLLAHEPLAYTRLGRLVARAKRLAPAELVSSYATTYMKALGVLASRGKNCNVLQHMVGYLKGHIASPELDELEEAISDYRRGFVPLVVPVTLVRHHVRKGGHPYLEGQIYLEPHPKELMLRNHV